jgi:CheY-like chemotaxis protein
MAGGRALTGLRIVLVDDNRDFLESTAMLLELNGAEVRRCGSAAEAHEVMATFHAHLLVSDLEMPGQSGFDLIMSIRRLPVEAGGRIPAIALSSHTDVRARRQALESGFEEFVPKSEFAALLRAASSLRRP